MRILVPVDGSAVAERAVAHAISLVNGHSGAEIVLLNVQNQETLDTSDISGVTSVGADTKRAADRSKQALAGAVTLCRNANATFTVRAAFGPIADTIVAVAREVGADQIVIGNRGLGPLRGAVLGSVSARVVQQARVPVTLVK
jgi:nucleotide-binding universal stress UspA family protein